MPEDTIEDRIATRVVELLKQEKFKIEAKRWPEVMSIEVAAEYIDRSIPAVRNLHRFGQIPAVRADRSVQFRRVNLDEWAARAVERL